MRALLFIALCLSSCRAPSPSWTIEGPELVSNDGAWLVRWRTEPSEIPLNAPFHVEVQVLPADGSHPPEELSLEVDAAMPHHRHGMNRLPRMLAKGDGSFRAEGMLFAKLLTSPMPHARVRNIDASEALALEGVFAVLTADDILCTGCPRDRNAHTYERALLRRRTDPSRCRRG